MKNETGFLSLRRKNNQSIFIGDDITVTVKILNKMSVKLLIKAPIDKKILREEIAGK